MAKKQELLEQASKLKLEVSAKNTIAQIEAAIAGVKPAEKPSEEKKAPKKETIAKAGKRSAKAIKEEAEAEAKEARKVTKQEVEAEAPKKKPVPKTRTRLERRSKSYKEKTKLIDANKQYNLKQASEIIGQTSTTKFDASVELHINLNVDPRQADQNIRGTISLPNGTGKTQRVAVFATADKHEAAKKAGADIVGEEDFLQMLDKEQIDFDVLIAMPQVMAKLGKYARLLGPKGLMPNPKSGTVTADVAKAVKEAKGGRVEYRVDKQGIVHNAIGKASFTPTQIAENAQTLITSIADARPASVKGAFIQRIALTTTMGPSIKVNVNE